jgi:phosphopantothenoylcysteine decarboxylase/phosphopantothenate--cysteine ligase
MNLKNKRVLITAGPTWVAIDKVRIISNTATGRTGILLAQNLKDLGAKVTLVLGPTESCCLNKKIRLIRFKFFEDLRNIITHELRSKKYNILIHSAAVSDYRPKVKHNRKISSNLKQWRLNLVPTVKIIDLVRRSYASLYIVGFKFEPQAKDSFLLTQARNLKKRVKANLVVANTIDKKDRYRAYVINQGGCYGPISNRAGLVRKLIKVIGDNLCRNLN